MAHREHRVRRGYKDPLALTVLFRVRRVRKAFKESKGLPERTALSPVHKDRKDCPAMMARKAQPGQVYGA
jgi:hypothetical protein